jgi:hypothetical protein
VCIENAGGRGTWHAALARINASLPDLHHRTRSRLLKSSEGTIPVQGEVSRTRRKGASKKLAFAVVPARTGDPVIHGCLKLFEVPLSGAIVGYDDAT